MADQQKAKETVHRALMVEAGHRYLKASGVALPSEEVWELVRNCATPEYGTYRLRNWLKGQTKSEFALAGKKEMVKEKALSDDTYARALAVAVTSRTQPVEEQKHTRTCARQRVNPHHRGKCSRFLTKSEMEGRF